MIKLRSLLLCTLTCLSALPMQAQVASDDQPYHRVQQKSVHNAYQRNETLSEMLNGHGIRSLELDIHSAKRGRPELDGNWYVYHTAFESGSSVDTLSEGLELLRQFHEAHPRHEVITLWMDIKDEFSSPSHTPDALDKVFDEHLDDALFSPSELLENCPAARDLQDTVQADGCSWPDAGTLRGRFMIILTETPNRQYIAQGQEALTRRAFIAPQITKPVDADQQRFAVFFNMEKSVVSNSDSIHKLQNKHLVTRTWDLNDRKSWQMAAGRGVNHLATDKVNTAKDPWATTQKSDGDLFAIIPYSVP